MASKSRSPASVGRHERMVGSPGSHARREWLWKVWMYGAVAVSAFLVVITALSALGSSSGAAAALLARLSLTGENNPAAWWSGMLLAILSLHAYDGYASLRRRDPRPATAWALLAGILLFFSADEVGSIHERLSVLGQMLGLGTWSLLLPIGAVLAALLGYALLLLWSAGGEQRGKVWLIAVGFALLGSVALQEFLEHRIQWQSATAEAIRAAVEEGTELAGMLVLLGVAMANTAGLAAPAHAPFAALSQLRRPLMVAGLVLTPVLAFASAALTDQDRGHPADWLAAIAFLAAALAAVRWLFDGTSPVEWRRWVSAGLCGLASVVTVEIGPAKSIGLGAAQVNLRLVVLGVLSLLVIATWRSMSIPRAGLLGAAVLVLVAGILPWSSSNLTLTYALSSLLALVMFWGMGSHDAHVGEDGEHP